jgi:hypothetical protein
MNRLFRLPIFAAALGLGLMACASGVFAQSAEPQVRDLSLETAQAPDPAPAPIAAPAPVVAPAPVAVAPPPAPAALVAALTPRPRVPRYASHRPFRAFQAWVRSPVPVRIHRHIDLACSGR